MTPILSALLGVLTLVGPAPRASELVLMDQFGEVGQVAMHKGDVVVVIVVTARRLRTVKPWEQALLERYGDLQTVLVADVPDEPPSSYERVAAKLVQRVPEGVRVLIDLDRVWASELSLDTSRPNLLLLDPEGRLVTSHAGRWSPEGGRELFAAIDHLVDRP